MKPISVYLITFFFLHSCGKTIEDYSSETVTNPLRFFPSEKGFWQEYQLDTFTYAKSSTDLAVTERHYTAFLREEVGDSLTSFTQPYPIELKQYTKLLLADPWIFYRNLSFQIQSNYISKKEANLEFVKLQFPIHKNQSWLGNRFIDDTLTNIFASWNYQYSDLNMKQTVGAYTFDSTIKVIMYIDSNAIERNYFYEVYAANVGLIYAEYSLLKKENGANPWTMPENGFVIRKQIRDWKK